MLFDKTKFKALEMIIDEGKSISQVSKELHMDYSNIYNWYIYNKRYYIVIRDEKDNKDHISHLDIKPQIYSILARANIYSIEELKRKIKDRSIYRVRCIGDKYIDILRKSIIIYENTIQLDIIISIIHKELRFYKFSISLFDIDMHGIFEYNINTKEEKLYIDSKYDIESIKGIIIKEIKSKDTVIIN